MLYKGSGCEEAKGARDEVSSASQAAPPKKYRRRKKEKKPHPPDEEPLVADLEAAQQPAAPGRRLAEEQPLVRRQQPLDARDRRGQALRPRGALAKPLDRGAEAVVVDGGEPPHLGGRPRGDARADLFVFLRVG